MPFLAIAAKADDPSPDKLLMDRLAIREVIDNWVLYRDAGDWERFRTVWHSDSYMMATWFEGPATEFAKVSSEGMNHGVNIMHFLGGTTIDLAGNRAVAQTKMTISQRAPVHDVVCDVLCTGRFWDFFEKRNGRWAIVRNVFAPYPLVQPIELLETQALTRSAKELQILKNHRSKFSLFLDCSFEAKRRNPKASRRSDWHGRKGVSPNLSQ